MVQGLQTSVFICDLALVRVVFCQDAGDDILPMSPPESAELVDSELSLTERKRRRRELCTREDDAPDLDPLPCLQNSAHTPGCTLPFKLSSLRVPEAIKYNRLPIKALLGPHMGIPESDRWESVVAHRTVDRFLMYATRMLSHLIQSEKAVSRPTATI